MNLFCKATQVAAIFRIQKSVKHKLRNKKTTTTKKRWWKHFWRCSSHSSPHRSTRPWPISVCFAFIWATALRGVECQTQHLWLSTASWQQVSVFLTRFSKTRKHVWSCVRVCICTRSAHHMPLQKFHHRKFFLFLFLFFLWHVEAPLLCLDSDFWFTPTEWRLWGESSKSWCRIGL